MMYDKTLPIKGGWVLVIQKVPTEIDVPVLSIWYAMPKIIFDKQSQFPNYPRPTGDDIDMALKTLWRRRCGAKIDDDDSSRMARVFQKYYGYDADEFAEDVDLVMKVEILTPEGNVCLMPHEYNIVSNIDDYFDMIDDHHVQLKELGGVKAAKKIKEMIFYCQTRGISRVDALKLCAGEIRKQNILYLQLHEVYGEFFGLVDTQKYKFVK